jgi:hypothetical protein
MVDRLFLSKGCPECAAIRAALDMEKAFEDDFKARDGQGLLVYGALSNAAAREILDTFGHSGKFTPLLQRANGEVLTDGRKILDYMRRNGMTVQRQR